MERRELDPELVRRLREFADVSFADAVAALEASDGELLDALLWLEAQGKIPTSGAATYSTRDDRTRGGEEGSGPAGAAEPEDSSLHQGAKRAVALLKRWLVDNRLEAYHRKSGGELQIPLGVALALLCLRFWLVPALLIVGLCFGWRYRLAGPDLGRKDVNQMMDDLNDTAADVVSNVKRNLFEKK